MMIRKALLYKIAGFILPAFYRWVYKCEIRGMENIPPSGRVILASSHVDARDPLFLGAGCTRQIHFMAKDSLFKNKFIGAILRYAGAFPVERGTGDTDALSEAYKLLEEERVLGVFLEGTRSKDGNLLRPKTGVSLLAYKTKAVVVPVSIIAAGGTCPMRFKQKMMVNIGKPISFEELNIPEESSMYFRRAAKFIMERISVLRAEAISLMEEET
ncbi:MAG: lysophospholipid acyltransferase family protein [Oscillospiraceae bacterium]